MPLTLWSRFTDLVAGAAGRAAKLDADDRRSIPGWPCGLDLRSPPADCVSASVSDRGQRALTLFWDEMTSPASCKRSADFPPLVVIEGGRSGAGADVRT